ncbi:hypothetical protein CL659_05135 [bacterium]|nr:hypothetical protein [bacterium]|tara:strand:- start:13375 stop:15678 length:2304 start_codon:yes stop_codon:yes gene_type:complete
MKKVKIFFQSEDLAKVSNFKSLPKSFLTEFQRFLQGDEVVLDLFWDFRDFLKKADWVLIVEKKSIKAFEGFKNQKSVILDSSKNGSIIFRYRGKDKRILRLIRKISPKGWILEPLKLGSFLLDLRSLGVVVTYSTSGKEALDRFKRKNLVKIFESNNQIQIDYHSSLLSKYVLVISDYANAKILIDPLFLKPLVEALKFAGSWVEVSEKAWKINKIASLNKVSFAPSVKFFNQIEAFPAREFMSNDIKEICDSFLNGSSLLTSARSLKILSKKLKALSVKFNIHPSAMILASDDEAIHQKFDNSMINLPLLDYQEKGALFLSIRKRALLGDEMGLGKTVQAIAAIEKMKRKDPDLKVLIVVPASLRTQWRSEFNKFTGRNVEIVRGKPEKRQLLWKSSADIKIVNYELLRRDIEVKEYVKDGLIVLDECQRVKNWKTKTSKIISSYAFRYCFGLSGTPLENSIEELYTIMKVIQPSVFGPSPFGFRKRYLVLDRFGSVVKVKNIDEVRKKMNGVFLRRRKDEVLDSLPELTESVRYVKMSISQKKLYRKIFKKVYKSWESDRSDEGQMNALEGILRMREACTCPELLGEQGVGNKLKELIEIIESANIGPGKKMIIFTQWVRMGKIIGEFLREKNINSVFYHGALNQKNRDQVIDKFKNDSEINIFIATDAASSGLNLQFVDLVVNFELLYNPAKIAQRVARAHRIGSKNSVLAIHLVSENTVEEKILSILERKKNLFHKVLESCDFEKKEYAEILSKKELIDLLLS